MEPQHRISAIWLDQDSIIWRCQCGTQGNHSTDVDDARYAAAQHQLPQQLRRAVAEPQSSPQWQRSIDHAVRAAAVEHPDAWSWYCDPAGDPQVYNLWD